MYAQKYLLIDCKFLALFQGYTQLYYNYLIFTIYFYFILLQCHPK